MTHAMSRPTGRLTGSSLERSMECLTAKPRSGMPRGEAYEMSYGMSRGLPHDTQMGCAIYV